MKNVLLVSEDYIKTNSELSDNLWSKYLLPSVRDMQDINLREALGNSLYEYILDQVSAGTLSDQYKVLVDDYARIYLLHLVCADVLGIVNTKIGNLGAVHTSDERVVNLTDDEVDRLLHNHQNKANHYRKRMCEFILDNRENFPELNECDCEGIRAALYSNADCGIWLGGARGKRVK